MWQSWDFIPTSLPLPTCCLNLKAYPVGNFRLAMVFKLIIQHYNPNWYHCFFFPTLSLNLKLNYKNNSNHLKTTKYLVLYNFISFQTSDLPQHVLLIKSLGSICLGCNIIWGHNKKVYIWKILVICCKLIQLSLKCAMQEKLGFLNFVNPIFQTLANWFELKL